MSGSFGGILRKWRSLRRFSQLRLAEEVGVSSRHISFLETGRSSPSKEIIVKLSGFLHIPRREVNRALMVSGYAPIYRETIESDSDMNPIYFAVDKMINDHMPFPAIVLNQEWDLVKANAAAIRLLEEVGFNKSNNLIESLAMDDPKTSKICNWGETASVVLNRVRYEIDMLGSSSKLVRLEHMLRTCVKNNNVDDSVDHSQVALNTQFRIGGEILSFFSVVSQLGAVLDVIVSGFKIEMLFPCDEVTKKYYEGMG